MNEILYELRKHNHNFEKLTLYIEKCLECNDLTLKSGSNHHILPYEQYPQYSDLKLYPWNKARVTHSQHIMLHYLLFEAVEELQGGLTCLASKGGQGWKIEMGMSEDEFNEAVERAYKVGAAKGKITRQTLHKDQEKYPGMTIAQVGGMLSSKTSTTTLHKNQEKYPDMTIAEATATQSAETVGSTLHDDQEKYPGMTIRDVMQVNKLKTVNKLHKDQEKYPGMTIAQVGAVNTAKTRMHKTGRFFDLYHINLGLLDKRVEYKTIRRISQMLPNTTKEMHFGKRSTSFWQIEKQYKGHLKGLYVIEV